MRTLVISPAIKAFLDGPLSAPGCDGAALRTALNAHVRRQEVSVLEPPASSRRPHEHFLLKSATPLFSYQREVVDKLHALHGSGQVKSALVSLPTGGGKTRTGLWLFRELLETVKVQKMLWLAPSAELVEQAVGTLKQIWEEFSGAPELFVDVNGFGRPMQGRLSRAAVFTTSQLAANSEHKIRQFAPDLLVFDEAHQAVARTFQATLRAAKALPSTFVLGLSATPGRSSAAEGSDLRSLFDGNLVTSSELGGQPVKELINRKVLSRLSFHRIPLPNNWDAVRVQSLHGSSLSVDKLALNHARFWATVDTVVSLGPAKCLVFCASIAHCIALVTAIRFKGGAAEFVSHATPVQMRKDILRKFAAGDLTVLINKSLLATGYDCPGITDIVLASPIRSPILWEQILGRASRGPAVGGPEIGAIWELDDHRKMHSDVQSYARFASDLWA